jgi:hypothetical protein
MVRALDGLTPASREKLQATLSGVSENFGTPRRHAGLGLRKLGLGIWECRFHLALRVILIQDADGLLAFDIMNHDQVRAWLRKH